MSDQRYPRRSWRLRIGLSILGLLAANLGGCRREPPKPALLVGGIQVNEPILDRWISGVRGAGLNTVATTVYAKQADWDSPNIRSDVELAPLRREITAAKKAGLQVVLILRVALDHAFERNRFLWHGMISPRTDADVDAWFDAYTDFVLRWARLAESTGVDVFGIGSELNRLTSTRKVRALPPLESWYLDAKKQTDFRDRVLAFGDRVTSAHRAALGGGHFSDNRSFLDARSARWRRWAEVTGFQAEADPLAEINRRRAHHERRWRQLIKSVRAVYRGRLTYAANFDQYQDVTFWDALDVMGINAYFELRPDLSTGNLEGRVRTAWRRVFKAIADHRSGEGLTMPVLFTEVGYTNRRHSTVRPWAQSGFEIVDDRLVIWEDEPQSFEERVIALEAIEAARCEVPDLWSGLLYWKLSSWPDQQKIEPFAIVVGQSDPAEQVLRRLAAAPACPK